MPEKKQESNLQESHVAPHVDERFAWMGPFCLSPDERCNYSLATPWSEEGHVYATDGRICVRVKSDVCLPKAGSIPPCPALFADFARDDLAWMTAPRLALPSAIHQLDPWWRQPEECEQCGHESGEMETVDEAFDPCWIGGHWFGRRYLSLIQNLPVAEVAVVTKSCCAKSRGSATWCLLFRADGGIEGVLMGMASQEELDEEAARGAGDGHESSK